jgi:alanine-synthesizing transaminase
MNLGEDDIIVTAGVTEAILFINDALVDKGDRAVLLQPYYPQYRMRLMEEEGVPLVGRMVMARDWEVDIDGLRKSLSKAGSRHRPKYMMVTNPHNPTGKVLERKALQEIVDVANDHGLLLISDEIYDELVYNGRKFTSMGQVARGVPHVILNGSSKNFDSTGFRIGFMMIPGTDKVSELLKAKFSEYALARLSVNTPAEYAVAEAIRNTSEHNRAIRSMVKAIERRVNLVVDMLGENPHITVTRPCGSFYIFPKLDLGRLTFKSDEEFITSMLVEEGVQLTGGHPFGEPSHFRIVALPPEETLNLAMEKLNTFCRKHSR